MQVTQQPGMTAKPAETIVSIEGLRKSFGNVEVLRGVDLKVGKGEAVVIVGSSGSGKSTCLRCINRLEEPTAGTIRVGGHEVTGPKVDLDRLRRGIGMVFQGIHLYPHKTALGNVSLALRKVVGLGKEEAETKARHHLEVVGLSHKADAYPAQLSGGQQQRVGIARAMALEPQVMLFDEPTSALDPEMVKEVLDTMMQLARDGMTMICVTHEMGFAREVGDRIVFMDHGKIVESCEPRRFFSAPQSARAREFLGQIVA